MVVDLVRYAINDQGQIVGTGYNPAGFQHAFLMDTRAVTYSYTSTGSAVAIKDKSSASKAMTLTDNATITDLNVSVKLSHTRYADLKFELIGPDNVTRLLCNAGAVTGSGTKTLVFDDDGAAGTHPARRRAQLLRRHEHPRQVDAEDLRYGQEQQDRLVHLLHTRCGPGAVARSEGGWGRTQ